MRYALALMWIAASAVPAFTVSAQEEPLPEVQAPDSEQTSYASDADTEVNVEPESEPGADGDHDPMSMFGVTLKFGFAGVGTHTFHVDGDYIEEFGPDKGFLAGVGLNILDGHGFGLDVNLAVRRYGGPNGPYGDFTVEPIMGFRMQVADPLYLFVGAGPRFGVGWGDLASTLTYPDATADGVVGVRVPIQATVYFTRMLAAVVEFGIGWDTTVRVAPDLLDPDTDVAHVDWGLAYDLSVGLRFR